MPFQESGFTKEDLESVKEEIIHEFHVVSEDIIGQVKLLAEGVAALNEKLDKSCKELEEEIHSKTQPIVQALLELL